MIEHKIVIIGSGFSGICMGIKLKKAGITDFVILEKAKELGGTWRENSYPGAECDIPSALYSYSFEPNPNWKHVWSKRDQIFQYQLDVAKKHGLLEHILFNETVSSAKYDRQKWHIETDRNRYCAQHFISAIGQLHERATPTFNGAEDFIGEQFHAAKWNHDVDLTDKNVAVIGAAASAVQLIPEVAQQAKQLTVFQRTPNWMMPKPNRAYLRMEKWLARKLPFLSRLYRNTLYLLADGVLYPALNGNRLAAWFVRLRVRGNLNKHIKDPELKAQLTPNYTIGAKRILFSHTFYQALNQPNVVLQTGPIDRITPKGIQTAEGIETPAEVIIYATGFITNPFFKSISIQGRDERLDQAWSSGAHAFLGIHTHGFPNLHMMYGPNTNLGHNSIIIMIEAQADFITQRIKELDRSNSRSLEVTQSAELKYNTELQARLNNMVFSKIEKSWYMDNGKITNNWAGSTWEYKRRLKNHDQSNYLITS